MNKNEFLRELEASLRGFRREEVGAVLDYYDELISDRMESGANEFQAVRDLGDIKYISRQIQAELAGERVEKSIRQERASKPAQKQVSPKKARKQEAKRLKQESKRLKKESKAVKKGKVRPPYLEPETPTWQAPYGDAAGYPAQPVTGAQNSYKQPPYATYGQPQNSTYGQPQNTGYVSYAAPPVPEKKGSTVLLVFKLFSAPALIPIGIVLLVLFVTAVAVDIALVVSFGGTAFGLLIAALPGAIFVAPSGVGIAILFAGAALTAAGVLGLLTLLLVRFGMLIPKYILKMASAIGRWYYGGKGK